MGGTIVVTVYVLLFAFLLYAGVAEAQHRAEGHWPAAAFVQPTVLPRPPAFAVALFAYGALLALDGGWLLEAPSSARSSGVLFVFGCVAVVASIAAWRYRRARGVIYSAFTVQAIDLFRMLAPREALARVEMWRIGIMAICVVARLVDRHERSESGE